jgi:hypothetical protein
LSLFLGIYWVVHIFFSWSSKFVIGYGDWIQRKPIYHVRYYLSYHNNSSPKYMWQQWQQRTRWAVNDHVHERETQMSVVYSTISA